MYKIIYRVLNVLISLLTQLHHYFSIGVCTRDVQYKCVCLKKCSAIIAYNTYINLHTVQK